MKEKDRSSHCRSNCVNVPKFVHVSIELDSLRIVRTVVLTSVRTASTYLNSLMLVKRIRTVVFAVARTASTYLSSLTFAKGIRTVVLTVVRTASMYLSSLTFAKVHREKATGFGGSYREIIMKKFRIFYQTKLGGLHLMVLL